MKNTGQLLHSFGVFWGFTASFAANLSGSSNHPRLDRPYCRRRIGRPALQLAILSGLLLPGLTAQGQSTPATLTPSSGKLSTSQTFTWKNGAGPTVYTLLLGTTGEGSTDLYNSEVTTATSATVSIPADGVTIYCTLRQLIGGTWLVSRYTFTESGATKPATLTPSSGALATSQTFTWKNGAGPVDFVLLLGTTGEGSTDLYNSEVTTATSATISIPAYGVTVFGTLRQLIGGTWLVSRYTFTESGATKPATLTPSSGALATSQTFTWKNGAGPVDFVLLLGTTGPGSANIYNSEVTTATSDTVSIPTGGSTIYGTLRQLTSGAWQVSHYTFTEPRAGVPTLTLSTTSMSLGTVDVGGIETESVTLTSSGTAAVTISAASVSGTVYTVSGLSFPVTLNPGQTAALTVSFAPTAEGPVSGKVTLTSNSSTGLTSSITLNGTGQAELSGLSCTSGSITGAGTDTCTLTLNAAAGTGGKAVYLLSNNLAVSVPSMVKVPSGTTSATFTATVWAVSTAQMATLTASSGGALETYVINLGAPGPTLTLSTTNVSFGTVAVGGTGTASVTLRSSGTTAVMISAGSVSGTGYTISGMSFPVTLNPGQTATFTVNFAPSAAGLISGAMTLTSNSSTGTVSTISLSGTGQPVLSGLTCINALITGAANDACTVTLNAAAATGGFPVSLASNNSMVSVPASVTVAAGTAGASFSATVSAVSTTQSATISASALNADPTFVIQLNAVTTTGIHLNAHGVTDIGTTLTASPITVPLSNVAAGDLIVCEVSLDSHSTFASVSDPVNGTYSPAITLHYNSAFTQQLGIFAIPKVAAGNYSVSLAWTGGSQVYNAIACESWTGVATSAPQDANVTQQQDGSSIANPTSGSPVIPATAGELVIGNLMTATQIPAAGANYSLTDVAPVTYMWPEYWIQTTATATNAPYTNSPDTWTDQMVAFKPISSGTGVAAPTITSATTASGTVGSSFSYQITATNSPTSYGAAGLPAGLTVNTTTGLISGTPTAASTSAVTLTTTNAGGTGTASMSLVVSAGEPALSVNASNIPFGDVADGTPSYQSVTLTSSGTAAVTVSAGSVSGAGYTISGVSFPSTLNPSQTATLEIEFDPTTTGESDGLVTMTSNSSTGTTSSISLSGTGVTASYEVSLNWDAPTGSSDPVAGYNIYRAISGSSMYQLLNKTLDATTAYTDPSVQFSTSYDYYVESVDGEGNQSAPSNTYTVSVP
jgi:hypothetical protein